MGTNRDVDKDNSGDITIRELKDSLGTNRELTAHLEIMGVHEDDLHFLFDILDYNNDGQITHEEFARQLWKVKAQESSVALSIIRHSVEDINKKMLDLLKAQKPKEEKKMLSDVIESNCDKDASSKSVVESRGFEGIPFPPVRLTSS